jgi:hypothetical protein
MGILLAGVLPSQRLHFVEVAHLAQDLAFSANFGRRRIGPVKSRIAVTGFDVAGEAVPLVERTGMFYLSASSRRAQQQARLRL